MEINILITEFHTKITLVKRDDNIKAFVDWVFVSNEGEIKIIRGTIRQKPFGKNGKLLLTYDPPSIKTKFKYITAFFIDNPHLYKKLCEQTIEEYCQQSGEMRNNEVLTDDDYEKIPE